MSERLKAATTGAPPKQTHPYEFMSQQLDLHRAEFQKLLGQTVPVDRFIRVVRNAILDNPRMLGIDRPSFIRACMKAAADGLMPDGKEAVINVYNVRDRARPQGPKIPTAKYLPMVGGLIKKLYESGHVKKVDAVCVFDADQFKYTRGDEPKIIHEPSAADDPGDIFAAYAIVHLSNGEVKREVMFKRDLDRVRGASAAGEDGPWVEWPDQMAIKSVLKRIYKQLPSYDDMDRIVASDNAAMDFAGAPLPQLMDLPADVIEQDLPAEKEPVVAGQPPEEDAARAIKIGEWIEAYRDAPANPEGGRLTSPPDWVKNDERYKASVAAIDKGA